MKKFFMFIFILFTATFCVACMHSHSYTTSSVEPTATSHGYKRHICSCGEYYDSDFTCLLTFESVCTDNSIDVSSLPNISSKIVEKNHIFTAIDHTKSFKVANYIGISIGQPISSSTKITIVWQPRSQAEKACLDIIEKVNKLYELSYNYNPEDALLRVSQYLRTVKYTGTAWNIMGGNLDSNFVDYVSLNQGNYDVVGLRNIDIFSSPITGENIDFIHMFAVINAIENTDGINSGAADVAGWIGDLCTLVQEIVKSGVDGDDITDLANQKFNSSNSSFGSLDLIADMDAINIMQNYYISENKTFAQTIEDYYFTTTTSSRKSMFLNNVFGKTYNSATTMVNDIITRLENNFLANFFCGTLNINITTHREQFLAVASAFANYFI